MTLQGKQKKKNPKKYIFKCFNKVAEYKINIKNYLYFYMPATDNQKNKIKKKSLIAFKNMKN